MTQWITMYAAGALKLGVVRKLKAGHASHTSAFGTVALHSAVWSTLTLLNKCSCVLGNV